MVQPECGAVRPECSAECDEVRWSAVQSRLKEWLKEEVVEYFEDGELKFWQHPPLRPHCLAKDIRPAEEDLICCSVNNRTTKLGSMVRTRSRRGEDLEGKGQRLHQYLVETRWVDANSAYYWEFPSESRSAYPRPIFARNSPPVPIYIRFVAVVDGVACPDQILRVGCLHSCEHHCPRSLVHHGDLYTATSQNRIHARLICIVWNHDEYVLGPTVQTICPRIEGHSQETHRNHLGDSF